MAATYNGVLIDINATVTTSNCLTGTVLGATLTAGKSYVIMGWHLWVTNLAGSRNTLAIGDATSNAGTSAATTYAHGVVNDSGSAFGSLISPWVSAPGTSFTTTSGNCLILTSDGACTITGYIMALKI